VQGRELCWDVESSYGVMLKYMDFTGEQEKLEVKIDTLHGQHPASLNVLEKVVMSESTE